MRMILAALTLGLALMGLGGCSWFGGGGAQQVPTPVPAQASDNGVSLEQRMNALQTTLDQLREEQRAEAQRQREVQIQQEQKIQSLERQKAVGRNGAGTAVGQEAGQGQASAQANSEAPAATPPAANGSESSSLSAIFPAFQWYDPNAPKEKYDPYGPGARGGFRN